MSKSKREERERVYKNRERKKAGRKKDRKKKDRQKELIGYRNIEKGEAKKIEKKGN